ncbi:MAG: hypothetical protein M3063_08740 [Actinomycetota bacterium]|nr:hypothetical protein [Actinomycetota bacterium]
MRVAFVGKGGAGKSAIAGTFARVLARRGSPVLAVDSDPMPGLAFSLGLKQTDAGIPDDAVEERAEGEDGPRYRLRAGLSAAEAVDRYAVSGPDGLRFLQFGKLRGRPGDLFRSQLAFHQILDELPKMSWDVVGDLPGGTRQPFFGWGEYANTVLVVVEPSVKSLLAGRRLARLSLTQSAPERIVAVANKVAAPDDVERVRRATGLEVIAAIPLDDELAQAERRGRAPIDDSPTCAAVASVIVMVERLISEQHL